MAEVEHSEFRIVKLLDAATPTLLTEDTFVFDGTDAGIKLEPCFIKSWSTSGDADDRPTEDYSGSHVLYQDVFIPTLDTGTLIVAHEGYWY